MKTNHTEASMLKALRRKFGVQDVHCRIENAYVFKSDWESDFLIITKAGYVVEFEVKISKADFQADKKKVQKHSILEMGKFTRSWKSYSHKDPETQRDVYKDYFEEKEWKNRPHRFYYVVPSGMLASSEVPKYAGLMCVNENGTIEKVKEAPFIHKEPLELSKILANKFFYYFEKARAECAKYQYMYEKVNAFLKENGIEVPYINVPYFH